MAKCKASQISHSAEEMDEYRSLCPLSLKDVDSLTLLSVVTRVEIK